MKQNMLFYTKLSNHLGYRKLCSAEDPTMITESYYNESTAMTCGVFTKDGLETY